MEIIEILRNHLEHDQLAFSVRAQFLEILNNVETQLNKDRDSDVGKIRYDNHVACCIDLEGLDGCGKSTLSQELYRRLLAHGQSARLMSTPPDLLMPFRSYFDGQPESIRRAFYNLGNLIVSFELKNQSDSTIILDRYWPSTIAYQMARLSEDQWISMSWPQYLVQPLLIVYIFVDENERLRRIRQRSIPVTMEEEALAAQAIFRQRLDLIYRNHIPGRKVHQIDGNRSTAEIADEIFHLFEPNKCAT